MNLHLYVPFVSYRDSPIFRCVEKKIPALKVNREGSRERQERSLCVRAVIKMVGLTITQYSMSPENNRHQSAGMDTWVSGNILIALNTLDGT